MCKLLVAAMTLAVLASPAFADDTLDLRCERYASSAVAQQLANTSQECGLTGPMWSSDHAYHYKWCVAGNNAEISNLTAHRREREHRLAVTPQCAGQSEFEFSCEAYSRHAIHAEVINQFFGCGFAGSKWSADYDYHFTWCEKGDNYVKHAGYESGARREAVEGCAGCWDYAYKARDQNQINEAKGCGFSGPPWKSDFDYHYKWCLEGDNLAIGHGQWVARAEALDKCGS